MIYDIAILWSPSFVQTAVGSCLHGIQIFFFSRSSHQLLLELSAGKNGGKIAAFSCITIGIC